MGQSPPSSNKMAAFVGIGFELIGLLLGAAFLGRYLDQRFGIQGLVTAGLVILALVGWLVHLVVMLKGLDANSEGPK